MKRQALVETISALETALDKIRGTLRTLEDDHAALARQLAEFPADVPQKRWYGVSFGNGNDGVSQSFPSFYVFTDDPWTLAVVALADELTSGEGFQWVLDNMELHGDDEDYTIWATLLEGPEGETEFGAAWMICEVFPSEPMGDGTLEWSSLAAAFREDQITMVRSRTKQLPTGIKP